MNGYEGILVDHGAVYLVQAQISGVSILGGRTVCHDSVVRLQTTSDIKEKILAEAWIQCIFRINMLSLIFQRGYKAFRLSQTPLPPKIFCGHKLAALAAHPHFILL